MYVCMYLCMYVSFGIYSKLIDGTNRFRKAHSPTAQHNPTAVSPKNTWFKIEIENSVSFLVFIINLRTVFVSVNPVPFLLRIYTVFLIDFCFCVVLIIFDVLLHRQIRPSFLCGIILFQNILINSLCCLHKTKTTTTTSANLHMCVLRAMRKYIHMLTHVRISTVQTH